jgi:alpha-ribazole phosphatase
MIGSPATSTDLYLVRHGETADEFRGRCYGSLDVPLSPRGVRQMEAATLSMSKCSLAAIYSSPRSRCVQSAQLIAVGHSNCTVAALEELSELSFGAFEGRPYANIERAHPELYAQWMEHPTEVQFPEGESFQQMRHRVLRAIQILCRRHAGQTFAVVTHGGVNRIVLADAMGLASQNIFRLGQQYAAINLIRYYGEHAVVELMNGRSLEHR